MEFNRLPDEYNLPPEEDSVAAEIAAPAPEVSPMRPEYAGIPEEYPAESFGVKPADEAPDRTERSRQNVLRRLVRSLPMPVAATVAAVALLFAAAGADPLGDDALAGGPAEVDYGKVVSGPTPVPTEIPDSPTPTPIPTPAYLDFPEGSVPGAITVTKTVMHGANEPDYHYETALCDSEEEALTELREWLKTWGGNPRFMDETSRTKEFLGYELSDDAVISGTTDSPTSFTLTSGSIYAVYCEEIYYDCYLRSHGPGYFERGDLALPVLPNLDPDFAGAYAWSGLGSEEYVRMYITGENDFRYLQMGGVWGQMGGQLKEVPGASYDKVTNTLTLNNCTAEGIDVNLMGNGFTVELVGESHIGYIQIWGAMYAGSVTFTGNGTLIVNEGRKASVGIMLNAEGSASALIVKQGVEIESYGTDAGIYVSGTTLDNSICFLGEHTLIGGGVRENEAYTGGDGNTYYNATVIKPDGDPATCVTFEALD